MKTTETISTYLPDEAKMKTLGYTLRLPRDPENPHPAWVAGEREYEQPRGDGRNFIKVYPQYGHVWIGSSSPHHHPASTVYNGVLSDEGFFNLLLQLSNRWPAATPASL